MTDKPDRSVLANPYESAEIARLAKALTDLGAEPPGKVTEYNKRKDAGSLIAELRMALAVGTRTHSIPGFGIGDAPDVLFPGVGPSPGFAVEVVNGSAPNGFSSVFYAASPVAGAADDGLDWRRVGAELQAAVRALPIIVTPWIDAALQDHHYDFAGRARQEQLAAEVARWLVAQLDGLVPGRSVRLVHESAHFDIDWQPEGPGRINGFGPLAANVLRVSGGPGERDTMNNWLENKLRGKAKRIRERTRREISLVGMVLDDAYALAVNALANLYYGASVHDAGGTRPNSYRPIPSSLVAALDGQRVHRAQALDALRFHAVDDERWHSMYGLFFQPEFAEIDGIVALYYTGALQFLPNPLARRPIEHLFAHLPPASEVHEHAEAAKWSART